MPKLKLGVAFYALAVLSGVWQALDILVPYDDRWGTVDGWVRNTYLVITALMTALLVVSGVPHIVRRVQENYHGPSAARRPVAPEPGE